MGVDGGRVLHVRLVVDPAQYGRQDSSTHSVAQVDAAADAAACEPAWDTWRPREDGDGWAGGWDAGEWEPEEMNSLRSAVRGHPQAGSSLLGHDARLAVEATPTDL